MNLITKIQTTKELKWFFLFSVVIVIVFLTSCKYEPLTDFGQPAFPDYVKIGDLAFEAAYEWQIDAYLGSVFIGLIEKSISYYFYSDDYPDQYLTIQAYYGDPDEIVLEPLSGSLIVEKEYEYKISLDQLGIVAEEAYAIAHPLAEEIYRDSGLLPSKVGLSLNQDYKKSNQRILIWSVIFSFSDPANIVIALDSTSGEVLEINNSDIFNK